MSKHVFVEAFTHSLRDRNVTFLHVITAMSLSNALPDFRKHALTRAHESQQHSLVGGARHTVARRFRPTVRRLRSVPYPHHFSFLYHVASYPHPAPRLPTPVAAPAIPTPPRFFFLRALRGRLLSRGCERDVRSAMWSGSRASGEDGNQCRPFRA